MRSVMVAAPPYSHVRAAFAALCLQSPRRMQPLTYLRNCTGWCMLWLLSKRRDRQWQICYGVAIQVETCAVHGYCRLQLAIELRACCS
jgi:hypothetical protein